MDIDGYKLCALYRLCRPNAQRTWTVFCRKKLREKVGARIRLFLGLKSAHTERLFVVISSEKISERFLIGAKVCAHEPSPDWPLANAESERSIWTNTNRFSMRHS